MATTNKSKVSASKNIEESVSKNIEKVNINEMNTKENDMQNQFMEMMVQMKTQLDSLHSELISTKAELTETKAKLTEVENTEALTITNVSPIEPVVSVPQAFSEQTNTLAERFFETMTNRKSDKEITIVHNREIIGGGTTHIKLSNMVIDFTHIGEERTLSYNQFEECVSNYRGFFERQIILVSDVNRDMAEKFMVPCLQREGAVLTRAELDKLGKMSIENLTKLYNGLTKEDKAFMLNYWMGQCYNKNSDFYDRTKIETLNALSGKGTFEVLLTYMNGEFLRKKNTQEAEALKKNNPKINNLNGNFVASV